MKTITVTTDFSFGASIVSCPFQTDVNSCYLVKGCSANFCPEGFEDEDGLWEHKLPETCPLRKNDVIVKLNTEGD